MRYLAVGGLTLDDIVTAGGSLHRRVPGGNALYTALGAALWSDQVGVLSFAGEDYPAKVLERLEDAGIDTGSVLLQPGPSVRLWILYEEDGARQISYQHTSASLLDLAGAVRERLPAVHAALAPDASVHLAALPVVLQDEILGALRSLGRHITLDSIEARGSVGGDLPRYWQDRMFEGVTAFLPSRQEFDVIRAGREDAEAVVALAGTLLPFVLVKDGAAGVQVYDVPRRTQHHVPALPVEVVDPTGAGDAFCGGFLVGLAETGDPLEAALRATVSASFVIERLGALHLLDVPRDRALARLEQVRARSSTRA